MKVDYLIQLFKSSNKKIWNNKVFSYFLIALVIGFTVILRKLPQIYYKYLLNPVLLLLVVILIILITSHNYSLGIILGVCLIALYYPTQQQYQNIYLETFENENDTIPIEKTDKNIIDDQEPIKEPTETEEPKVENKKTVDKTDKKTDKSQESDEELESDEEAQSEDEKSSGDEKEKEEKEEKISGMRLENLNPSYYKKKTSNSSNSSNSSNNKKIVENFEKTKKSKSNNKSKSKPQNKEETFLGDVRKIVNDLDTGNNKMNANNAIKKISELMYNKHKTSIQQILNNADDDSDTEDDDEI